MPSILIEVKRNYTVEEEISIMDAVHNALVEAFKIKSTDRHVRLIAHEPHRFACPPNRKTPEYSTHISIDCLAGRTLDAKRQRVGTGTPKNLVRCTTTINHVNTSGAVRCFIAR